MTDEERTQYLRALAAGDVVALGFERFRREWAALTAGMSADERREALGVVLGVMLSNSANLPDAVGQQIRDETEAMLGALRMSVSGKPEPLGRR